MRIAIPYYEGMIYQHFGHAKQFKLYEIENHQVLMEAIVEPENGVEGHRAVADFLRSLDVRAVICGNIGEGAMKALNEIGIAFYGGVSGPADDAITALVGGALAYDPNIRCTEHDRDCGGDCSSCPSDCSGCTHCG